MEAEVEVVEGVGCLEETGVVAGVSVDPAPRRAVRRRGAMVQAAVATGTPTLACVFWQRAQRTLLPTLHLRPRTKPAMLRQQACLVHWMFLPCPCMTPPFEDFLSSRREIPLPARPSVLCPLSFAACEKMSQSRA